MWTDVDECAVRGKFVRDFDTVTFVADAIEFDRRWIVFTNATLFTRLFSGHGRLPARIAYKPGVYRVPARDVRSVHYVTTKELAA